MKCETDRSGESLRKEAQNLGKKGIAFVVVFDNCTAAVYVRDETLHNKSDFVVYTVVYALEPAVPRTMFTREAVDYGAVASLSVTDFFPSSRDAKTLEAVFGSFISQTLIRYLRKRGTTAALPKLSFPMPDVKRMDPKVQPKFRPLCTQALDESKMDDLIQIEYAIADDVGLSESQIQNNLVLFGGDLYTVELVRYKYSNSVC